MRPLPLSLDACRFFVVLLSGVAGLCTSTADAFGQLSANSGINGNDTYVVFNVTVQSNGTLKYQQPLHSTGGATTTQVASSVRNPDYHVEAGFDTSNQFVMNVTPLDPVADPTTPVGDNVGLISVRANTVVLYDTAGNAIPVTMPYGAIMPGLFPGGMPTASSLTSMLVTSTPNTVASQLAGTVSYDGPHANATVAAQQISKGSSPGTIENISIHYQANSSGTWTLSQIARTRTSATLGAVTDNLSFTVLSYNTNAANDAVRAANSPAVPNASVASPAPLNAASAPATTASYPVVGPGAGAELTLVHGLLGSGGPQGSWGREMEPWLTADMSLGNVTMPDLGWGNALATQTSTLLTDLSGQPPTILIAHSQGGLVARRTAQLEPGLVNGVMTVDTPHQGAWIALTGPAAAAAGMGWALSAACGSWTNFPACALGGAFAGASGLLAWDLSNPAFLDLVPGSGFLATVNAGSEPVPRISIESHSNKRWVEMRVLGDIPCDPESWCGGRAWYDATQGVYYFLVAKVIVESILSWFFPSFSPDLELTLDIIAGMDAADLGWDIGTGAFNDSSDGIVPGGSQAYPGAQARLIIQGADSHTGNLKSPYVKTAIETELASQFAVPARACQYAEQLQLPQNLPFYGGQSPFAVSTSGANPGLCPWQAVAQQPWAQTGPLHLGSGSDNLTVDFNLSPVARSQMWSASRLNELVNQAGLPQYSALGSIKVTGIEQTAMYQPGVGPGRKMYNPPPAYQVWDNGVVTINVNGTAYTVDYAQGSTSESVMTALVNQINGANTNIKAGRIGEALYIATTNGTQFSNTDYSLSVSSATQSPYSSGVGALFPNPSFHITASGSTLLGNP